MSVSIDNAVARRERAIAGHVHEKRLLQEGKDLVLWNNGDGPTGSVASPKLLIEPRVQTKSGPRVRAGTDCNGRAAWPRQLPRNTALVGRYIGRIAFDCEPDAGSGHGF